MPNVKDFKAKKDTQSADAGEEMANTSSRSKRRPGRDEVEASDAKVQVVDVEEGQINAQDATSFEEPTVQQDEEQPSQMSFEAEPEKEKVEIRFFGSELLRTRFSKPFEVAEAVATDWKHGGDFAKLPIHHPLAQYAAQQGLLKAKELEKKVLESPVTEKVAMQVLTAGMKAQSVIEEMRSRLQKKNSDKSE